jgi:hypothetical protein
MAQSVGCSEGMMLTLMRQIRAAARRAAFVAAFAWIGLTASVAPAQVPVPVQQVESFENQPTNTHYAPVNFNGSATATDPINFPGITFRAQANTTDTLSNHAFLVGQRFYSPGTPGQPFINSVFAQTADNFINSLNTQSVLGTGQPLPSLNLAVNGIRVSNHSYVADFGLAAADENAIRRLDFVINRDDVVVAAGAVTGGGFANQNLIWSARNTLAVRSDDAGQPFDPASSTIVSGRRRADTWSDSVSSFATGQVSSSATALIGTALTSGQTNASHTQVVRSFIMTGADKSVSGVAVAPWTRDTANNLDIDAGAGKLNHAQSLSILNAGERTLQTVTANTIPNVSTTNPKGWSFGTTPAGGQQAVVFSAFNGIQQLTATLNWNVTQTAGATIDTSDAGRIFSDLALELRPVTLTGGVFTVGPPTGLLGLSSNATLDNVEHLYFTGGNLPPGTYALLITGDAARATVIGLSYSFLPVPEPVGLLLISGAGLFVLRRKWPLAA